MTPKVPPFDAYRSSQWRPAHRADVSPLRLGQTYPSAHPLFAGYATVAFLSPEYPFYQKLAHNRMPARARQQEHHAAHTLLRAELQAQALVFEEAVGEAQLPDDDGQTYPEAGYLIFGVERSVIEALARAYGQAAFVFLAGGGTAQLWHCPPEKPADDVTFPAR